MTILAITAGPIVAAYFTAAIIAAHTQATMWVSSL